MASPATTAPTPAAQITAAVTQGFAQLAQQLSWVVLANPQGGAAHVLDRPDSRAAISAVTESGRRAALSALAQAWQASGGPPGSSLYQSLTADIERLYEETPGSLTSAVAQVFHTHPDVPFDPAVHAPGSNPSFEAAQQRAQAVASALHAAASRLALRNAMSVHVAASGGHTEALRAALGIDPSLQFPHPQPIDGKSPPKLYRGVLHGPPLHPNCRCTLAKETSGVLVWHASMDGHDPRSCAWCKALHGTALGEPSYPAPPVAPDMPGTAPETSMVSSTDIADMPAERYQALRHFIASALHELGQVLARLLRVGQS